MKGSSKFKLTIDENNKYYAVWRSLDLFLRVLSAFLYAEVATFDSDEPQLDFILMVLCESFFLVSCILRFFVTYVPEGENIPVTDLGKTAKFYLKGRFIYDFIPLLPLHYIGGI